MKSASSRIKQADATRGHKHGQGLRCWQSRCLTCNAECITIALHEVLMPSKDHDKNNTRLIRHNASLVKKLYPNINRARIQALRDLTKQFSFALAGGDVIQLENGWFVTHTGLVRLARRKRCRGIHVETVDSLWRRIDSSSRRRCIRPKTPQVSSAMATLTPRCA
jgi:hypothetical protein